MNLYFRKSISLVDTADTAVATDGIETKTFAAKKSTATATVTAPKRGLFYVYIKAKSNNNAFGGYASITEGQEVKRYIDFTNGYYDSETADSVVTRPIGPIWLNADKEYTVTFTELIGENTTLELDSIELHEVKQNLWMVDNTNQDFGGVSIDTHGWELDPENTDAVAYVPMTIGGLYGETYYSGFHRNQFGTSIHLPNARIVGFKFNAPVAGTYKVSGKFKHRSGDVYACNDAIVGIKGTNLEKTLTLNVGGTTDVWSEEEIGIVTLEQGTNVITFHRGVGGNNLCMEYLTFTPCDDETVASATAKVEDAELTVGEATQASVEILNAEGNAYTGAKTVTWKSSNTEVAKVDANGEITTGDAGVVDITATVEAHGCKFTSKVTVTVKEKEVLNDVLFGNVYAYIQESTVQAGKYDVFFVGGINTKDGYKAVGFDVTANDATNENNSTSTVYEKISAAGTEYTAADFGANCQYIFFVSETIGSGTEVTVNPYIVDENGEKIYYGKTFTMTVKE